MDRDNMRFGEYIRFQRLRREITLREMSEALGISLSMLSDIEQMRKKPFNTQAIDRFCSYLGLSEDERIRMLDMAERERGKVPSDLNNIMMNTDIGDMARFALRMSNAGYADAEDWKKFIWEIERKRKQS